MAWFIMRRISRRTNKKIKSEKPYAVCSRCGTSFSKYWLMFIANQATLRKEERRIFFRNIALNADSIIAEWRLMIGGDSDAES